MIVAVSLRLLYLIFQQVLGLILQMDRAASTKDVELLVLRHEVAVRSAARTGDRAWTGRTGPCSPPSSGGCPERCEVTVWSPRARSCAGTAASCARAERKAAAECHEAGGLPPEARLLLTKSVSEGGRLSWCTSGWT